jgi:hypothetical protein
MARSQLRGDTEAGFSLIEAAIALLISVILFLMLAQVLGTSFIAARNSRLGEQATQLGVEGVELSRSLPWAELAMDSVEAGDPRVTGGAPNQLLAAAAGLAANEDLVVDAAGSVQATYPVTIDNHEFEVRQYVTEVEPELRRVVVMVTWDVSGSAHEQQTSALVSDARSCGVDVCQPPPQPSP